LDADLPAPCAAPVDATVARDALMAGDEKALDDTGTPANTARGATSYA
jgi:hypothetical protein